MTNDTKFAQRKAPSSQSDADIKTELEEESRDDDVRICQIFQEKDLSGLASIQPRFTMYAPYPFASPNISAKTFKTTTNAVTIKENEIIAQLLLHSLSLTHRLPAPTASFPALVGSLVWIFKSCRLDHNAWKMRIKDSRHVRCTAC
jgi:hypothetical protein